MNYTIMKKLLSAEEILQRFHLPLSDQKQIMQHRREIKNILAGADDRLLMVVGPCSAWPKAAVFEYAEKLHDLSNKVKNQLKIIMRAYVQKPRTKVGWLGPAIQPDPHAPPDIDLGTQYTREMMLKIIKLGLPIGTEILFTHNFTCFQDLLSWACIGARSSEDQEHRIFASALNCPVGLKNPTHGSLDIAMNSVLAAQHSHIAAMDGYQVQTSGNSFAHLVLRGSNGDPNFSTPNLEIVKKYIDNNKIKNPALLIDASHDNSLINGTKNYRVQPNVILEVLNNVDKIPELKKLVKGFMVESFLREGNQSICLENPAQLELNGLSITDPCLSWEQTEHLLLTLAKMKDLSQASRHTRKKDNYNLKENVR